jgi:hypothetical protein
MIGLLSIAMTFSMLYINKSWIANKLFKAPIKIEITNQTHKLNYKSIRIFYKGIRNDSLCDFPSENDHWYSSISSTKIFLHIPEYDLEKETILRISIGKKEFEFTGSQIREQWNLIRIPNLGIDTLILYEMPSNVRIISSFSFNHEAINLYSFMNGKRLMILILSVFALFMIWLIFFTAIYKYVYCDNINYFKSLSFRWWYIFFLIAFISTYIVFPFISKVLFYYLTIIIVLVLLHKERIISKYHKKITFKFNSTFCLFLIILFTSFAFRVYKFDWQYPVFSHSDEPYIVNPVIKMLQSNTLYTQGLNGRPDHLGIYINSIIYDLSSLMVFQKPALLSFNENQTFFFLVSRILSAIWGSLVVVVAFFIGREFSNKFGIINAISFALFPSFVRHSHFITPEMLLLLFICMVILFSIRYIKSGKKCWLVLSIISCALGTVEKYPGVLSSLIIVYAVIMTNKQDFKEMINKFIFSFVIFILSLLIISPYFLLYLSKTVELFIGEASPTHLGADGLSWFGNLSFYLECFLNNVGIITLLFLLIGFFAIITDFKPTLIPLFFGFLFWIIISKLSLHWERWVVPMYISPLLISSYGISVSLCYINSMQCKVKLPLKIILIISICTLFINLFIKTSAVLIDFSLPSTTQKYFRYIQDHKLNEQNTLFSSFTFYNNKGINSWVNNTDFLDKYEDDNYMSKIKYIALDVSAFKYINQMDIHYQKIYNKLISKETIQAKIVPMYVPIYSFNSIIETKTLSNFIRYCNYVKNHRASLLVGDVYNIYLHNH